MQALAACLHSHSLSVSHLKVVEWYLVGGELGGEEGDADDDEEEAVQARTHDEERRPAKKEEE